MIQKKTLDMKTIPAESSHMENHQSLESQQVKASQNDFIRAVEGLELHGFTPQTMRRGDGVLLLCNADSSWTVEVTQTGLVRTQNESSDWADFYTWQFHNQSRLLYTEAE